jgi:hypothetical protein
MVMARNVVAVVVVVARVNVEPLRVKYNRRVVVVAKYTFDAVPATEFPANAVVSDDQVDP